MPTKSILKLPLICASALSIPFQSMALNFDGTGHYSLNAETRTHPGASSDTGLHQATNQSFRLEGEARLNDKSSFFMELRLFDSPRAAYLGDHAQGRYCEENGSSACPENQQNVRDPGYKPYSPSITKAYAQYALDMGILKAGRRGRDWALGIFLDSGTRPFAKDMSVYDGVSLDINIQKYQTLGVSIGYDKLAETGTYMRKSQQEEEITFGSTNKNDDVDQYYLMIEYNDVTINAGSPFTKQIGFYASKMSSGSVSSGGSNTDLSLIDLYTAFYINNFAIKNEVLFTLGKTADPNSTLLGGAYDDKGSLPTNKMNSIAVAGEFIWNFAQSGSYIGPEEFQQGDFTQHQLVLNYAYAPGDSDGYYKDKRSLDAQQEDDRYRALHISKRKSKAGAVAFHGNYQPALIMFNAHPNVDSLKVDGIFDPARFMNTQLFSVGYRYTDAKNGNFEGKFIYAQLNEAVPSDVADYYNKSASKDERRPFGFYGSSLGVELDLKYWRALTKDLDMGVAGGFLFPGEAWQTRESEKPVSNFALQTYLTFKF